ncbi:restriction endonuclease, partial [Candidatus Woesearchaeota archaeon]|nr:restriction endonuclease [Candidatus Woesearchaeota archaeon]
MVPGQIKKENIETTKDKGDALEKNIEFLFQLAGFETQRNVKLAKYEIDVLAKIGDRNIIIECKNFQNSNLTIRNLIHQWNSKNKVIKANKIIIVIAGVNIKSSDKELADNFDIELWSDSDLTALFNLSLRPSQLREKLLNKISFKPIHIFELYRDEIAGIII